MMALGRFLLLIFAAGSVSCSKEALEIIPSNGDVELGKKMFFLCKVRKGGEATLTWLDPEDTEIDEYSEPYKEKAIDELSKGMEITLLDPQKEGIFTCKGDFDSGGTAITQIRIRVIQKPTFVTKLEPVTEVLEGTSVNFSCQAAGIPPPTVRWIFGNQDLNATEDKRISVEHGMLVIKEIRPADAGVYTCEARIEELNEVASTNVSLNVKYTPKKGLGVGGILLTVLAILLVVLLVVDACCYYKCRRGLLMFCRNKFQDKNSSRALSENNGKMLSKSGKTTVVNVSGIDT